MLRLRKLQARPFRPQCPFKCAGGCRVSLFPPRRQGSSAEKKYPALASPDRRLSGRATQGRSLVLSLNHLGGPGSCRPRQIIPSDTNQEPHVQWRKRLFTHMTKVCRFVQAKVGVRRVRHCSGVSHCASRHGTRTRPQLRRGSGIHQSGSADGPQNEAMAAQQLHQVCLMPIAREIAAPKRRCHSFCHARAARSQFRHAAFFRFQSAILARLPFGHTGPTATYKDAQQFFFPRLKSQTFLQGH